MIILGRKQPDFMRHTMALRTITIGLKSMALNNSAGYMGYYQENPNTYNCDPENRFQGPTKPYIHDLKFDNNGNCLNESESVHWCVASDKTEYVGQVVKTEQTSERIMSDVWDTATWVIVFNPTTCGFERKFITYTYEQRNDKELHFYTVDATDDIKEVFHIWNVGKQLQTAFREYDNREQAKHEDRITPNNGKWVTVVKGRNVPKGTTGLVFWTGTDNYGKTKVGIATTARKENNRYVDIVWTAASNCKVSNNPTF
jgi:hypothetical protein